MARTVAFWIALLNVLPLAGTQREAAPAAAVETEPAAVWSLSRKTASPTVRMRASSRKSAWVTADMNG
jgi:hypothetical protein